MKRVNLGSAILIAAAALVIGAVFGQPGSGRAAGSGPTSTGTPTIEGTAQEGQTLTSTKGSWSVAPTSVAYAWSRCDASGSSCTAIGGPSSITYKPVTADVGHTLRVTVTATDAGGSTQATSAPSAVISSTAAPTPTTAPAISGTSLIGGTLTASQGTWSGSPTSYAFAWSRCDAIGDSCATIDGATSATYTVTAADAGSTLRVVVTATNGAGSTTYTSPQTTVVPGGNGCPAGTGAIPIAQLTPPARLMIDKASITPSVVTLATHTIQLHFHVTACNGRPVQGATVWATPIPYNQFAPPAVNQTTGPDGTVTLIEARLPGFPARPNQGLLAVFARATKRGEPILGGISTRRTVAFRLGLH